MPVECDVPQMIFVISKATLQKATLKNTKNKSRWNFKKSCNPLEGKKENSKQKSSKIIHLKSAMLETGTEKKKKRYLV